MRILDFEFTSLMLILELEHLFFLNLFLINEFDLDTKLNNP
jgi:hypothetical protein